MKTILIILTLFSITQLAHADVFIASDKKTGDIYSMSSQDDFAGTYVDGKYISKDKVKYEKLSGNLEDYVISHKPTFYRRVSGSFALNVDKVAKAEKVSQTYKKVKKISSQNIKAQMFDLYENDLAKFAQIYPIIGDLIQYKDFPRLKKYINGLLAAEFVTQQEYNSFVNIL